MTLYHVDTPEIADVLRGVREGDRRSLARCLRWVDDAPALGRAIAFALRTNEHPSRVIGITGNPGAGKSTVVDALVRLLRDDGKRVAVLAVDPSSPFSGGAILGDRIRMAQHTGDDGVFIRSLATRGHLGGLSRATFDSVRVLSAARFDVIVVETVGVGQDEVDIARLAQTTVVVMVPGLGDDVQSIKAGILEIADVYLVNKADRPGVGELEKSLRSLMSLAPAGAWEPPILRAVATQGEGMRDLCNALTRHEAFLATPEGGARDGHRRVELFERLLDAALVERGRAGLGSHVQQAEDRLARGESSDPYAEVTRLLGEGA